MSGETTMTAPGLDLEWNYNRWASRILTAREVSL